MAGDGGGGSGCNIHYKTRDWEGRKRSNITKVLHPCIHQAMNENMLCFFAVSVQTVPVVPASVAENPPRESLAISQMLLNVKQEVRKYICWSFSIWM